MTVLTWAWDAVVVCVASSRVACAGAGDGGGEKVCRQESPQCFVVDCFFFLEGQCSCCPVVPVRQSNHGRAQRVSAIGTRCSAFPWRSPGLSHQSGFLGTSCYLDRLVVFQALRLHFLSLILIGDDVSCFKFAIVAAIAFWLFPS